jgi:hypothetical protein
MDKAFHSKKMPEPSGPGIKTYLQELTEFNRLLKE